MAILFSIISLIVDGAGGIGDFCIDGGRMGISGLSTLWLNWSLGLFTLDLGPDTTARSSRLA